LRRSLIAQGLECYRIQFPKGMDANEYALKLAPAEKSHRARDPQGRVARQRSRTGRIPQLSRTRIPRMTESSFSFSSTCKPFLLENRIAVLRLAAEVLGLMEGTEPIDLPPKAYFG